MTKTLFRSCLIAFLFSCVFSFKGAHAGSFTVYPISGDNGYNIIGIDSAGDVMLEAPIGCSGVNDPNRCFELFSDGRLVSESDSLINFTADNGSACAYDSPGGAALAGRSMCNGDEQVAGIRNDMSLQIQELSNGGLGSLVLYGTADVLFLNHAGDFVVTDGLNDEIYQVVQVTPEPTTLLLLGTAALATVWLARRRFQRT